MIYILTILGYYNWRISSQDTVADSEKVARMNSLNQKIKSIQTPMKFPKKKAVASS
jgi:hypothetical protein